jgi:hypothetical protein
MGQRHEWMTDGIGFDAADSMLAKYEAEGWELVTISWDSDGSAFMGVWKRLIYVQGFYDDMFEALEAIAGNEDAGPGIDAEELCELITERARAVLAKVRRHEQRHDKLDPACG